jgi:hypothetical protein
MMGYLSFSSLEGVWDMRDGGDLSISFFGGLGIGIGID